jgi:Flp pilus assembly protein TadB
MAQTKRKRRTKHRGNAAGIVENRGRTGRKPTPADAKADRRDRARQARTDRFSKPPTWRGAANRAVIATAIFVVVIILVLKQPVQQALELAGFMLLLYIPLGYYTDSMFYRRRQRKLGKG